MKYLRLFESREDEIHRICREYDIENYTINPDGSIDVDSGVLLFNCGLTELPLQFRRVEGVFMCSHNDLTTLKGAPKYIGGDFWCNVNNLTDLEYFPEHIGAQTSSNVTYVISMWSNPIWSMAQHFIHRENRGKIIELFNFSGVVQGIRVILNRLEYVFDVYDIEITDRMLKEIEQYYTIIKR